MKINLMEDFKILTQLQNIRLLFFNSILGNYLRSAPNKMAYACYQKKMDLWHS